jgi:hypothetical protein
MRNIERNILRNIERNIFEKYRTQHNKDLENIEVCKGTSLIRFFSVYNIYNVCVNWQREM